MAVFGIVSTVPFIFLDNVGVMLGWILGSIINLIAYITIVRGSNALLHAGSNGKVGLLAALGFVLRLMLYAAGLTLAAFCTFRWNSHFLHFWFVFAAMLPIYPILIITTLLNKADKKDGGK